MLTTKKPRRRLALTRKVRESVDITLGGHAAVLTITKIGRNRVAFWIEADEEVRIVRSELVPFAESPAGLPASPTPEPAGAQALNLEP